MALENDDLPKAPDKVAEKPQCSTSIGVNKVGEEKPPKPIKEKTNLEELDEIELETLLKETITYKSPRDRDCRSSLFNKLLVSAEDSIRKDSALNASGSEAVRHRNPQASRRSRYHNHRTTGGGSGGGGSHQGAHGAASGGKHALLLHGTGGGGGIGPGGGRREGKGCGGSDGGGSIAEKGTLGGSLNNLTVEDLYESISQHLQQRPEKSVSARQRTGGSLPCNVNAGLITPCETPLFITERQSSSNSQQSSCSTTTNPSTISTTSTAIGTCPITTTTYCSTTVSSNRSCINASRPEFVVIASTDATAAPPPHSSMSSTTLSTNIAGNNSSNYQSAGVKDCCVIDVEQEDYGTDGSTGDQMSSGDMIGVQSTATHQTKHPTSSNPLQAATTVYNNKNPATLPQSSQQTSTGSDNNNTNPSTDNNTTTILIVTNANTLLDGNAYNILHIDDDDIVEEQQRQYQHKLNSTSYSFKQSTNNKVPEQNDDESGTELQQMARTYRSTNDSSDSSSAGASSISDVDYYYMGNKKDDDMKISQRDRGDIERRPLLSLNDINLNDLIKKKGSGGWPTARVTGAGPMKIIGQGPQIKQSNHESLHKQLVTSSLQTRPSTTLSLEDPPITVPNTPSIQQQPMAQHLPSLSHHHSTQQPHHQHTGAVRISSLSSANMININNHKMRLQQQRDNSGDIGGGDEASVDGEEMAIGMPSTLTGLVGIDRSGDPGGKLTVGNYMSEATIHVGDVVDTTLSNKSIDQDSTSTQDYTKNYGLLKKIDDNGNHVTKSRKKTKPAEVVHAYQIKGHIGDIASGDINKVMAFICGNDDNSFSNNVPKTKTFNKSNAAKLQQHRGSVSGTNNRTGGKSVDAEHHSHSRRHQNHHSQQNQHNQPQNPQSNDKKLHRANSLEEMPTTTLEEFHENESKNKQPIKSSATKQINNQTQQPTNSDLSKKSDNNASVININNSVANVSTEQSVTIKGIAPTDVVSTTNNRGRGVLRATKSNAEKSGASRSGGSANRGSVTRSGVSGSVAEGQGANLQPRRSWTNADPSPLQAIATTASAENLETDFTLVNTKKKKGKKQQQRRNSVGSRTPLNNTQQQTLTSPPSNNNNNSSNSNQQQQRGGAYNRHNNNNNNSANYNSSNTSEYHSSVSNNVNNISSTASSGGSILVNLASLAQANVTTTVGGNTGASSHSDKSNGDCSSLDEDSVHSQPIDGTSRSNQSPPNVTSYASITKNNVATQQPIVIQPSPQPQAAVQTTATLPKWPSTSVVQTPSTTTTITTTMLTTAVAPTDSVNTAMSTVIHPENVIVAVQVKVVTNRSQEQQTDDIPPTLLLDVGADDGSASMPQQQGNVTNVGQVLQEQQIVVPISTEHETSRYSYQVCAHPPSLGDMQRWPSINNNNKVPHIIQSTAEQSDHLHDDNNTKSTCNSTAATVDSVTTWPSLNNNTRSKQISNKASANCAAMDIVAPPSKDEPNRVPGDQTARVVVRAPHVATKATVYVKPILSPLQQQQQGERIVLKDDRIGGCVVINVQNPVNSARHCSSSGDGGVSGGKQQYHGGSGTLIQNHVVVQPRTVVHPVMVSRHPAHCIPQTIIPLIPITTLPPPNLIDHNTPPPPNFIPNQQHQINNHMQQPYHQPQYNQATLEPQQSNCLVYTNIQQLPANIPDVQMIEHQLQLQHNNNNNISHSVHSKNSYNQPMYQPTVDFVQLPQPPQVKRPAVVIMRGNSGDLNQLNSPLGDLNANEADDSSCCELTFGFDVNEELLSLQIDETVINADEQNVVCTQQSGDGGAATMEQGVVDDSTCMQSSRDGFKVFANRFMLPDCCTLEKEFNYEKIVDFVANAWFETISDVNAGKCNFYQDL